MDFTREPIIETIITPKEGSKLVVRSSKGVVQEEYFCDAVQVVSYGSAFFFRSIERPKAFLVPVTDYEILEVREARMVLKNVGAERTIKIGGGREAGNNRAPREPSSDKSNPAPSDSEEQRKPAQEARPSAEPRVDKKRERRRQGRRRRGQEDQPVGDVVVKEGGEEELDVTSAPVKEMPSGGLTSILPPPSQLISETLQQYRSNDLFKDIFSRSSEPESEESAVVPELESAPMPFDEPAPFAPEEDKQ